MRRSRKSSGKKRGRKVSRRNSRKPNYSQKKYRRKTRKTRKTRKRQMTRKKLYGGSWLFGSVEPEPEPEPEPVGPIIFAVSIAVRVGNALAAVQPLFKEYSPEDNAKIYDAVVAHHFNDAGSRNVEIASKPNGGGPCNVLLGKDVIQYAKKVSAMSPADKQTMSLHSEMAWFEGGGTIPMFQYDEFNGDSYTNIRQIRIAKNRKEEWNEGMAREALAERIRAAAVHEDLGQGRVLINDLLIYCYKERPTLGNWPERALQFKNQSLLFYNNFKEAVGDSKPRGSSVIDITGSKIEVGEVYFPSVLKNRHTLIISPNPILNPPEKSKPLPFVVEPNLGGETYNGQTKTVALDKDGKMRIAFNDSTTLPVIRDIIHIMGAPSRIWR